jgi:hypothetical protein
MKFDLPTWQLDPDPDRVAVIVNTLVGMLTRAFSSRLEGR